MSEVDPPQPSASPQGPASPSRHDADELVDFDSLVHHRYGNRDERAEFTPLLERFQKQRGRIAKQYWSADLGEGTDFAAAVVLTDTGELHLCTSNLDVDYFDGVARVISQVDLADHRVDLFVGPVEANDCRERLYGVALAALDLLNEGVVRHARNQKLSAQWIRQTQARLNDELAEAERTIDRAAQRRAQIHYFRGMLIGLAGSVVLAAIAWLMNQLEALPYYLVAALVMGAIGSVVSVMTRMTRGGLKLAYEAGMTMLSLLGAVRPFVGAALASAILLLVVGGLVPLTVPPVGTDEHEAFLLGVAFIAGFSERWAQDMLSVGRGTVQAAAPANADAGS